MIRPALRLAGLVAVLSVASPFGRAVQSSLPLGQGPSRQGNSGLGGPDSGDAGNASVARMQQQAAKTQNEERQKKLVQDTARLYDLASQLKDEVGKTDQHTLSVQVVRKAEEIEKLAKSVKDRMRG